MLGVRLPLANLLENQPLHAKLIARLAAAPEAVTVHVHAVYACMLTGREQQHTSSCAVHCHTAIKSAKG